MAVLNFRGWQLRSVEGPAAAQLDHKSQQIAVTGDIPEGYSWDLLVMAPSGATDIWSLAAVGDGLAVVVTRGMVPEEGRYAVQLRGTLQSDNDTQRHTNIVQLRVLPSITAGGKWPVLPTEFCQAEARLRDIAAHPPIPGDGVWQLWDSDAGAYKDSELPLPSGADGVTPHIGDNGNWYLGDEDTGVAAKGAKGDAGTQGPKGPTGPAGPQGPAGAPGKDGTAGADGVTPHIGDNGNWYLGTTDTGKPSRGATGANGSDGAQGEKGATGPAGPRGPAGAPGKEGTAGADGVTPHIGDNGNWYLGTTDTGKPSRGGKGEPGSDASVTAANVAAAMGLSGLAADDQIMVSSVDADGKPTGWRKKYRDMLNVRDFGAKGDSTTDDTAAIQAALDAASTRGISAVLFPTGTYKVSATTADNNFFAALTVHSGQRLLFDAATLQLTANGYDFYAVLNIHNVDNVTVEGGLTIIGDRESHTATTGESGHGIRIVNSHNVHVSDVDIRYTWGDGVCVGGNGTMAEISQNVTLERIRTYKCSRNGLSIIEADGVVVRDCDFTYTDRTAPQYGIDVEPNLGTATNITIENVRMLNNGIGGFALYTTKATLPGVLTLRNIETDAKTIIYTSSAAGGTFDVRVDGWRHTQKSGETNPTLRLSGKGSLRIRQLYVVNKSANRVIIPLDIENLRMDGVTVEDDPAVSIKGTLSVQSTVNTSIGKAVITGFLSRNPAEETWYSGNQLTVDNLQDTVVNLNEHLTTGGSSESYKLLLCDKALVLGTALSAKARVFIPYTYGNVNPFRVVNTTATEVQLYTTVSAGITFVGDVPGGSSANSAALTGNASYEVTPMLASGLVYVRKLNTRVPVKTSEITNDSGYQTAAQVGAAIAAAVGAAMEASY
nr:MAG TPA: tail spike protein [Caudoviricetes sp.]